MKVICSDTEKNAKRAKSSATTFRLGDGGLDGVT
jgi:hypothetical protein